jgi:hypothetical protein
MRRYSVTLIDVTPDLPEQAFELPSSSLIPCQQAVIFSFVTPGHQYAAKVRGYDRADVAPQRLGSPLAVTPEGDVVSPRWTTECGKPATTGTSSEGTAGAGGESATGGLGSGGADNGTAGAPAPGLNVRGVTSASRFTVYAEYCLPLTANGPASDTAVSVELNAALYGLDCGPASGQVFEFTAELMDSSLPPKQAACGQTLKFEQLEPGRDYRFNVLGFENGSDTPNWETTCRVTTLSGTTTPASCDPLVQR